MQTSLCDVIDRTLWIGVVCSVIKPLVALIHTHKHTHTHVQAKKKEAALPAGWWIATRPVLPPSRHVCVRVGGAYLMQDRAVIKILYKMRIRESTLFSWLASCPVAPCHQLCRAAGVDQMKMSSAAPTHTLTHTYSCHIFRSLYILILLLHTHTHTHKHTCTYLPHFCRSLYGFFCHVFHTLLLWPHTLFQCAIEACNIIY